jgi:hypothetical protein
VEAGLVDDGESLGAAKGRHIPPTPIVFVEVTGHVLGLAIPQHLRHVRRDEPCFVVGDGIAARGLANQIPLEIGLGAWGDGSRSG